MQKYVLLAVTQHVVHGAEKVTLVQRHIRDAACGVHEDRGPRRRNENAHQAVVSEWLPEAAMLEFIVIRLGASPP